MKVDRGGEDAFLVSGYNGGVIAVADGVSGYDTRSLLIKSSTVSALKILDSPKWEVIVFAFGEVL